jgi:GR25 family glycosyltransferase involved in LPS biosynthesis
MVDHVYCINLERRHDRRVAVTKEFKKAGVENVQFWRATDGRLEAPDGIRLTKPEYGCADSHIRLWRDIVENNYETVLVFEDDVQILPGFNEKLSRVLSDLKSIPNWHYVNLGPTYAPIKERGATELLSKGQALNTHCYLISLEGARKVSNWTAEDLRFSIDGQLVQAPIKMYYTNEILADQGYDESSLFDIIHKMSKGDVGLDRTFDFDFTIRNFFHNRHHVQVLIVALIIFVYFRYIKE